MRGAFLISRSNLFMSQTYSVLVVGMGKRGLHHAAAFKANPRFKLAGIASRDAERFVFLESVTGN